MGFFVLFTYFRHCWWVSLFDGEFEFFWKIHMEMERKKVRNEREETTRVGNYRSDPTQ